MVTIHVRYGDNTISRDTAGGLGFHTLSGALRYQVQLHRLHTDWPDIIDPHTSEETEHSFRRLA